MAKMGTEPVSCTELSERCRMANDAYKVASSALDAGQRRENGATSAEWKAEFDARIELRHARGDYLASAVAFNAESAAFHTIMRRSLRYSAKLRSCLGA
jgi:hypothetical protein